MSWDDVYDSAEGLNDITKGLSNIRTMMREDEAYKEKKVFSDDVNSNMAMLSSGEGDASEMALSGTAKSQAEARRIHAMDLQSRKAIHDDTRNKKVESAYGLILADIMDKGQSFQQDRGNIPVDIYNEAMNKAVTDYSKTEQGKIQLSKTRKAAHDQNWSTFSKYKDAIQSSMNQGDKAATINLIERMSLDTPMPYSLKWDSNKGAFNRRYMHSGSGQWEDTGDVSVEQAAKMINETSQKKYAMNEYVFKQATSNWNNDAWLPAGEKGANGQEGKTQIYKKDGRAFYITPQKDPNRPNSVLYFVTDENNNQQQFSSKGDLMKAGFRFEDLKREKGIQDLEKGEKEMDLVDAKIRGQNALNQKRQAGASGAKEQARYKEIITEGAKYFDAGDQPLFDENGDETQAAENTRMRALEYYETNKDIADTLTGTEYRKFHVAKAIAGATDQMFQVPGKEGPPVEGARKAKDGNWYVQNDQGGYSVVNQKDGLKSSHKQGVQSAMGAQSHGPNTLGTPGPQTQIPIQGMTGDPMGKIASITGGDVNMAQGGVTFKPRNKQHLDKVFSELDDSGIQFDAKMLKDGSVLVSTIEQLGSAMKSSRNAQAQAMPTN